jgi:hypothetical protein
MDVITQLSLVVTNLNLLVWFHPNTVGVCATCTPLACGKDKVVESCTKSRVMALQSAQYGEITCIQLSDAQTLMVEPSCSASCASTIAAKS